MVQRRKIKLKPTHVRIPDINSIQDLASSLRMLDLADNLKTTDNTVPFTDSDGGNSFMNYQLFCDEVNYRIETYIRDNNIRFNPDVLAKNIQFLLKKHNIKISELEKLLGLSAGYISRATGEDSKRRLSIDTVAEIAAFFGISLTTLVLRDLDVEPQNVKPLLDYIELLCKQTDEGILIWNDFEHFRTPDVYQSWDRFIDEYNRKVTHERNSIIPADDVFIAENSKGDILIDEITTEGGTHGYIICVGKIEYAGGDIPFFSDDDTTGGIYDFHEIILADDDQPGAILDYCKQLYNCILTHKDDFHLSDYAQSYINNYLGNDSDNE